MIKKFNEFNKIEEGIVDNIKDFLSNKTEVAPKRTSLPPQPTPSNDPSFTEDTPEFEKDIRKKTMKMNRPEKEVTFPCVYSFMTKELSDRKRNKGQKHIGIKPDGYAFFCETSKELEDYKHVYRIGEKYKGETITGIYVGPAQN